MLLMPRGPDCGQLVRSLAKDYASIPILESIAEAIGEPTIELEVPHLTECELGNPGTDPEPITTL